MASINYLGCIQPNKITLKTTIKTIATLYTHTAFRNNQIETDLNSDTSTLTSHMLF